MNRRRTSQRPSQDHQDSFWEIFLSPLRKKQQPHQYDSNFERNCKTGQLSGLHLKEKPFDQDTCLSGFILGKLREQDKKTDIVRKRKTRQLDSQLSQFVNVSQGDSSASAGSTLQRQVCKPIIETASNSSQGISTKFKLIPEETPKQDEAITISDDEVDLEVGNKKEIYIELDRDEDLQMKSEVKRSRLEDLSKMNRNLDLSDADIFDKFINVTLTTDAHSTRHGLKQSTQMDNTVLQVKPSAVDKDDEIEWDTNQPKVENEDEISPSESEKPGQELFSDDNEFIWTSGIDADLKDKTQMDEIDLQASSNKDTWKDIEKGEAQQLDETRTTKETDEDEDERHDSDIKQQQLDQPNKGETPGKEPNSSSTFNRFINQFLSDHSAKQQLKQDIEMHSIDLQATLHTGSPSGPNIENTRKEEFEENEEEEKEEEEEEKEQLGEEQQANVKTVTGLARDRERINKEKSHQRISASGWNFENLKLYINRDRVHLVETLVSEVPVSSSEKFDKDLFSSLQSNLINRSRQLLDGHQHFNLDDQKGLLLWSFQFTKPMLKEQVITFMVLEIIGTVCDLCNVQMKPEEYLEKNDFPNARSVTAGKKKVELQGPIEL